MRPNFSPPLSETVATVVTHDMVATLGGQKIHPVLATARMIEWMEWAGRKLILPYLDDDEDAVGYQVDIVHLRPTLVGEEFSATAELIRVDGNRIITTVTAQNSRGQIGKGTFVQVLLPKVQLQKLLADLENSR
ncbi:MAG: thioesterase [Firmicutes bacterium]|nr:thioesterase [Bacillota bacterium]